MGTSQIIIKKTHSSKDFDCDCIKLYFILLQIKKKIVQHTVNIIIMNMINIPHSCLSLSSWPFRVTTYWGTMQKKWLFSRNCWVLWNRPKMSLVTTPSNPPFPPRLPPHTHLLVCLPFAAVRTKLYLMAAIASPCILASADPKSTFPLLYHVCCKCRAKCLFFVCANKQINKIK